MRFDNLGGLVEGEGSEGARMSTSGWARWERDERWCSPVAKFMFRSLVRVSIVDLKRIRGLY